MCQLREHRARIFFSSPLYVHEFFLARWSCARIFFLCICTCRIFFFKITHPPPPPQKLNGRPLMIVIFLSLLSFWVEPYVYPLLRKHFTYKTYQCKFYLIVPEEGWFGQPKYSTPSKSFTYVVSVFASIFLFLFVKPIGSLV